MKSQELPDLHVPLLQWYDAHARTLPWRDDPTPYRVWISEIMLQQTRVDTVMPYFERFIKVLPAVRDLAAVEEERLLKLWEGLGYYHRAKNLKKAAVQIMEKYAGELPPSFEELKKLPGIGPYSAGAIASIAFGARVPAVDGNVLRVIARITANGGDIGQKDVRRDIEEDVMKILPYRRTGDFNQALMELGATVCLPNREPVCHVCPVSSLCDAYGKGIQSLLPVKSKRNARRIENRTVFVILRDGRGAVRKRPEKGLLPGLWELPNVEGCLTPEQCEKVLQAWNIVSEGIEPLCSSEHIFTHIQWHMTGYLVHAEGCRTDAISGAARGDDMSWATLEEMKEKFALPSAFRAYTRILKNLLK